MNRLRIFGARAWAIILPKTDKLEKRAQELRMVGYAGTGYRLWEPQTNEIIISRDVRFDEREIRYEPQRIECSDTDESGREVIVTNNEDNQIRVPIRVQQRESNADDDNVFETPKQSDTSDSEGDSTR